MTTEKDMERIAKLVVRESDLKTLEVISCLRVSQAEISAAATSAAADVKAIRESLHEELPLLISREIVKCQRHRDAKGKWNIRTALIILGLAMSNGIALWSVFGG
jgi:hypothetical protein